MGMRSVLGGNGDLTVVGEADDGASAETAAGGLAPEVVVTELELPDRPFSALVAALRASAPAARLLVLSGRVPDAVVRQTVLAGASGYAFKSQTPVEIVAAIRDVARGRQVVPNQTEAAGEAPQRFASASTLGRLSVREREIFDLIIWGQTNKQVAQRLGISVKTVETHRSHINGKLQVHSAAELVRLASLCGALSENGPPPELVTTPRAPGPQLVARTG